MTKDEVMKLALEALEEINKLSVGENAIFLPAEIDTAMDAIKEALAQPEQIQPSAYSNTHQPERTWVGLTDEEIGTIAYNVNPLDGIRQFSRAIEAKLKEKNT